MARLVRRREQGETLIEVLIAVAILGIVAVALIGGLTTVLAGSSSGRQSAHADQLLRSFASGASAEAEEMPWDTGCPVPPVPASTLALAASLGFQPPTLSVAALPKGDCSLPNPGIERITLIVAPQAGGSTSSLEIWVRQP